MQQLPLPVVPQVLLAHAAFDEHGWPALRRHCVPPTHVVFGAQPVLGGEHEVAHDVVFAHANPLGHGAPDCVVQPVPLQVLAAVNVEPLHVAPAHATHARPFDPHALFPVPARHVPPSGSEQQPPEQATLAEQTVSHVCVPVSHVTFVAQSPFALHPHVPPNPPALATHAVPALRPAHA